MSTMDLPSSCWESCFVLTPLSAAIARQRHSFACAQLANPGELWAAEPPDVAFTAKTARLTTDHARVSSFEETRALRAAPPFRAAPGCRLSSQCTCKLAQSGSKVRAGILPRKL